MANNKRLSPLQQKKIADMAISDGAKAASEKYGVDYSTAMNYKRKALGLPAYGAKGKKAKVKIVDFGAGVPEQPATDKDIRKELAAAQRIIAKLERKLLDRLLEE